MINFFDVSESQGEKYKQADIQYSELTQYSFTSRVKRKYKYCLINF
jgi:hypothetical protein